MLLLLGGGWNQLAVLASGSESCCLKVWLGPVRVTALQSQTPVVWRLEPAAAPPYSIPLWELAQNQG